MKSSNSFKKIISLVALLLSVVMLFSACGNSEAPAADETSSVTESAKTESTDAGTSSDEGIADATQSAEGSSSKKPQSEQGGNIQTQTSGSTKWAKDYLSTIPASVKAKEIHILMWRKYDDAEQKLVDSFQKKTGIKIRTTVTTEAEYTTKLISLVTGGNSPDIAMISTDTFPGVVTKACVPLDAKTYRLDDPAWYKPYMDCFKVNGKYFSVAMNKSLSCEDTNHVLYYLKSTMDKIGVKTYPWQLYKQGKWNWDAQRDIIAKASAKGITGLSMHSYDTYMQSTGSGFVKYNGKEFINNMEAPNVLKAWKEFTSVNENYTVTGWDYKNIATGNVALFASISYQGFRASKVFRDAKGNPTVQGGIENIECVPIAGPTQATAYTPVMAKSWANPKGSKNPEGAAYFLRYFLDIANTDYENLFHNNQIKEVYNEICSKKAKKCITYGKGIVDYVESGLYNRILSSLKGTTSANVKQKIDTFKKNVNSPIKQANKALKRMK